MSQWPRHPRAEVNKDHAWMGLARSAGYRKILQPCYINMAMWIAVTRSENRRMVTLENLSQNGPSQH
jgi:hypothetical protein